MKAADEAVLFPREVIIEIQSSQEASVFNPSNDLKKEWYLGRIVRLDVGQLVVQKVTRNIFRRGNRPTQGHEAVYNLQHPLQSVLSNGVFYHRELHNAGDEIAMETHHHLKVPSLPHTLKEFIVLRGDDISLTQREIRTHSECHCVQLGDRIRYANFTM